MTSHDPARVTIAIPTRNRRGLLARTIESVLKQTHRQLEIIVSDNCSTDDTGSYLDTLQDPRFVILRQATNLGMVGNWNACLAAATGSHFLLLSDDDELEPDAIERLVRLFLHPPAGVTAPEVRVAWSPCMVQNTERAIRYVTDAGPPVEAGIDFVTGLFNGLRGPRICGVMTRTVDSRRVMYSEEHGSVSDIGHFCRVALQGGVVCCLQDSVVRYTVHDVAVTSMAVPQNSQRFGEAAMRDMVADLERAGAHDQLRRLNRTKRNYITNVLATVLMHAMGRPGWYRLVASELLRAPQYYFTPHTARRLLLEGRKLLRRGGKR